MIYKIKNKNIFYHDWDWKSSPNWKTIKKCVDICGDNVIFNDIETNSDDNAVLISDKEISNYEIELIKKYVSEGNENILEFDSF